MHFTKIWLLEFIYTLRVGFLANLYGSGGVQVYKNNTCLFKRSSATEKLVKVVSNRRRTFSRRIIDLEAS